MTAADQARVFAAMVICGACIGIVHDLLAVFRRGPASTGLADIALGVIAAAFVGAAGLALRCNPFRLFSLLGVIAGWAIYALSLGTIVRVLLKFFIKLSKKVTN